MISDHYTDDYADIGRIVATMKQLNYKVFENDTQPYNLNIVAVRSSNPVANKFNDDLVVFWYYEGGIYKFRAKITTLPGKFYLVDRLLNPKGAAILKPGQYVGAYKLGPHKGKYKALIQDKRLPVYRDGNRDDIYDYDPATECTGYYGINIHRASKWGVIPSVGKHSAGCIVVQDPEKFNELLSICEYSAAYYGNSFTFTLLREEELTVL